MQRLLTTTAFALVATMGISAQAQDDKSTQQAAAQQACAESWTAVDSDKSGTISQSEAQAAADTAFSRIDVDGSGTISVTEWKDCGDRSAYPGVPAALDNLPSQASATDAEGTAATEDMQASAAETEGMEESPASDQAEAAMEHAKREFVEGEPVTTGAIENQSTNWQQNFDVSDIDESGYLSPDEAAAAGKTDTEVSAASAEESARIESGVFASLDTDGDGQLSKDEWSKRGEADVEASLQARYGKIDADGNGEVTKNEWSEYRNQSFASAQQAGEQEPAIRVYYYYVW